MDQNIQNIILNVAANGLTSLIAYLCQRGRDFIIGEEIIVKLKRDKTALQTILQQASDSASQIIEWEGPGKLEEVCLYLFSPEVESIVRQLYSTKIINDENTIEEIKKEFLTSLSLFIGEEEANIENISESLFRTLITTCDNFLTIAIDDGILSAHEAMSAFRHRKVIDEIAVVQKNINLLAGKQKIDIRNIIKFEHDYRQQVAQRHQFIVPPDYDSQRKLPIESIYIAPSFIPISKQKEEEPDPIEIADVLSSIYRAVILGNPGGGKSTFANKVCYDLSKRYEERLYSGREITPILVILRDYGAEKKNHRLSILQFIELTANSKYQVEPPQGGFEYLLLNGRSMVIFDGLDELR